MQKNNDSEYVIYDITITTNDEDPLAIAGKLSDLAEIDSFSKQEGTVRMRFISSAGADHILKMCDDFKIEVESDGGTRLTYIVKSTML